jgi:hypothetical protein
LNCVRGICLNDRQSVVPRGYNVVTRWARQSLVKEVVLLVF